MICDQTAEDEETMRRNIGWSIFHAVILALAMFEER